MNLVVTFAGMDPNDRKYTNKDITVHWKPSRCIHATTCYKELREVFDPRKRPWVNMDGASTDKIIDIVRRCPTEALTYEWNEAGKVSDKAPASVPNQETRLREAANRPTEIRIMKDGPNVVEGDFTIIGSDGTKMKKWLLTSFCRCGASSEMPFCDGSHRVDNFTHSCD
jgi:uncharacterized Fe-S cluster protein YjdI/CDGSH-type Zn-finger protein